MEYFFEQHHQDVVLVSDEVLAAALLSRGHHALLAHQDPFSKDLYCLYKISRQLRKDIRDYYNNKLTVSAIELNKELDLTREHIASTECYIAAEAQDAAAKANG